MIRLILGACLVGAALATPVVQRSREDVEEYRNYLLRSVGDKPDQFKDGAVPSPAHPEMYSGKYQGDIVLDAEDIEALVAQYASGRNAVIFPGLSTQWPDNTVVWTMADTHYADTGQKEAVFEAMKLIESKTCVKFREREPADWVYVNMTSYPTGCFAHVGYRIWRGPHTFNLGSTPGSDCYRQSTIVHEWMHILGFFHMHSTYNRDDYVKIQYENIVPGAERDFDKWNEFQVGNLGVEYDYVSCLQYPELAWSKNFEPTIVPLRELEGGVMGQRDYVTEKDWLRINRYYDCPGAWD